MMVRKQPTQRKEMMKHGKAEGIAEQLKATNNLLWAKEMNNCKARAEEIVLREVVFR